MDGADDSEWVAAKGRPGPLAKGAELIELSRSDAKECIEVTNRRPIWPQCVIASHVAIFVLAGYALALTRSDSLRLVLTVISGTSLFILSSLVHEASHYNLARSPWLNDLVGNLAGYLFATPVTAYRACT